jgi:hypothetical protein
MGKNDVCLRLPGAAVHGLVEGLCAKCVAEEGSRATDERVECGGGEKSRGLKNATVRA